MSKLTLIALLLAASAPVFGADARSQLDAFADGLETLSGSFEQLTVDDTGRTVEESSGSLYFSRPDRFRWDYDEPFPQQMVADGERLWHYDESLDQVTVRDQPEAAESPLLVLTSPELLDRFYGIEPGDDPDVLEFVPLDSETDFERARLHFHRGMPTRLELFDQFGQLTRILLSDLVRNPVLNEEVFQFVVPEGVDVLEGY